jgi:hypothetical protein
MLHINLPLSGRIWARSVFNHAYLTRLEEAVESGPGGVPKKGRAVDGAALLGCAAAARVGRAQGQ